MVLQTLMDEANVLTDEQFDYESLLTFANQCLSAINTKANANYPFFTQDDLQKDMVLPEKWARVLFVPYISARIKQQDSSQFEYVDLFNEFEQNLGNFLERYHIPDAYKDTSVDYYIDPVTGEKVYYTSDIYNMPPFPWWNF